jgi:hypothetical protein
VFALPEWAYRRGDLQDVDSYGRPGGSKTEAVTVVCKVIRSHSLGFLGLLILKDAVNTDSDSDETL